MEPEQQTKIYILLRSTNSACDVNDPTFQKRTSDVSRNCYHWGLIKFLKHKGFTWKCWISFYDQYIYINDALFFFNKSFYHSFADLVLIPILIFFNLVGIWLPLHGTSCPLLLLLSPRSEGGSSRLAVMKHEGRPGVYGFIMSCRCRMGGSLRKNSTSDLNLNLSSHG